MLIDDFMPAYDVVSRHAVPIHAPAAEVYAAVLQCNLRSSWLSRALFALRGIPDQALTEPVLDRVQRFGFVRLAEAAPYEIVLGLIGRFWTIRGDLQRFDKNEFTSYAIRGFAKAAWNFSVTPESDEDVRLTTETRVVCLGDEARRNFRRYWMFIAPFSGIIRLEMLKEIRHRAGARGGRGRAAEVARP